MEELVQCTCDRQIEKKKREWKDTCHRKSTWKCRQKKWTTLENKLFPLDDKKNWFSFQNMHPCVCMCFIYSIYMTTSSTSTHWINLPLLCRVLYDQFFVAAPKWELCLSVAFSKMHHTHAAHAICATQKRNSHKDYMQWNFKRAAIASTITRGNFSFSSIFFFFFRLFILFSFFQHLTNAFSLAVKLHKYLLKT